VNGNQALELIAAIAGPHFQAARVEELVSGRPEAAQLWADVEKLAVDQRLAPFIYKRLSEANLLDLLPPAAGNRLKTEYAATGYRNLLLAQELFLIKKIYRRRKIDFILVKGLALAERFYRDLAARPARDLDILVKPDDFIKGQEALLELGYTMVESKLRQYYPTDLIGQVPFARSDAKLPLWVEIHQSIVDPPFFDPAPFWLRRNHLKLLDDDIPVLGREENIVLLCLHHAVNHWCGRLLTALDIALVLDAEAGQIDRSRLAGIAKATGLSWPIGQALLNVKGVFDVRIDDELIAELTEDKPGRLRRRLFGTMVKNGDRAEIDYPVKLALFGAPRLWWRFIAASMRPSRHPRKYGRLSLIWTLGAEFWRSANVWRRMTKRSSKP